VDAEDSFVRGATFVKADAVTLLRGTSRRIFFSNIPRSIGINTAVVELLRRSQFPNQTILGIETNVAAAARLARLFIEQPSAMAKLKGTAGQQKMTVEHVHFHAGGQAIVGPVTPAMALRTTKEAQNENRRNNS
jgi:hypothetical protein